MYDDKTMRVTDYSHSTLQSAAAHQRDLARTKCQCHHRKLAKKWRPLRAIISEITTAIRSRTLTSTNINTLQ